MPRLAEHFPFLVLANLFPPFLDHTAHRFSFCAGLGLKQDNAVL
jgi:hypothetical protein